MMTSDDGSKGSGLNTEDACGWFEVLVSVKSGYGESLKYGGSLNSSNMSSSNAGCCCSAAVARFRFI